MEEKIIVHTVEKSLKMNTIQYMLVMKYTAEIALTNISLHVTAVMNMFLRKMTTEMMAYVFAEIVTEVIMILAITVTA